MPSLMKTPGGQTFNIGRKLTSIGRNADNDIVIDEPGVADTHALITIDGGRFIVSEQARNAPLLINNRRLRRHELEHGDKLSVGSSLLTFNLWDEPAQSEAVATTEPVELGAYRRLAEFTSRLAETDDVENLLQTLMDEVIDLTGANKGFLVLCEGESLTVKTARNLKQQTIEPDQAQVSDSIIREVLQTRKPVIVSDALNDTQFRASASVVQLRLCSVMCVPLLFGGSLLGVIYVGNDNIVSLFEATALDTLVVFASQASLLLAQTMRRDVLAEDNARLRVQLEGSRFGALIGESKPMQRVFTRLDKVAKTAISVLIRGETGTGKELVAREIHRRSDRRDGPFVAINCGALPASLMESALFGHKRGSFTGALEDKVGCFQSADGGTLFLDEIGEMPPQLQVKLLRAIQERKITRVGDSKPRAIDIRLLTATHINLEQAIESGHFREDLYYRINVVNIELPPLRERGADIVLLAKHFVAELADEYDQRVRGLSAASIKMIGRHGWPGNIRELQNRLKKAVVLSEGPLIEPVDLELEQEQIAPRVMSLAAAKEDFQRRYIDRVLEMNAGNRTKTARDLDVDPRTIFRHLERQRTNES